MNPRFLIGFALVCVLAAFQGEAPGRPEESSVNGPKLPDGRSQREEILKSDYKKSLQDAAELVQLAEEFKADLERNDRHVLSLAGLKKLDNIERVSKRIRSRLSRY